MVANKAKPARTEACIIGAGASGAAVAKVLTENGVRVVGLEKGPWRDARDFRRRRARKHQSLQSLARPAAQSPDDARDRG